MTTGGQAAVSAGELRDRGALVDTVLCVVDRSDGQHTVLADARLNMARLFSFDELG